MPGVTRASLLLLAEPFKADELEWRLQQAATGNRGIWGRALAYISNRALMERLDQVCGPENWKNTFLKAPNGEDATLCGLAIRVATDDGGSDWVTKWDGAENTDVEPVKGGLSSAMKRAGVQWGIGRYLYYLENAFIEVTENGRFHGKTKDKQDFRWNPPKLPDWALPKDNSPVAIIRRLGPTVPDDATVTWEDETVNLKTFIRQNWADIQKDDQMAAFFAAAVRRTQPQ